MLVTRLILTGSTTGCEQYGMKEIGKKGKVKADFFPQWQYWKIGHSQSPYNEIPINNGEIYPSRQSVFLRES